MKNLIAYIDLLGRRYLGEDDGEDLSDELDSVWFLLSAEERDVANHVAKVMGGYMGVDE
jgi:hypothetical protein